MILLTLRAYSNLWQVYDAANSTEDIAKFGASGYSLGSDCKGTVV